MISIIVEKRDHQGNTVWQYPGEVIERGANYVCLRAVFDRVEANLGFVVFRQGDVFFEWFYDDRWYNIFQVHEGDTTIIKGWYCNITRPAHISDTMVAADDLELDVFVMPNGTIILLDEEEFDTLNLETDERMAALRAIQALQQRVAARETPFNAVR
ncbi:MAG: DUF402 domain-containing protein [Anaerolineae bacterium]|nr:DUF402 domain-containing protein [Anaerolineae bacterium]MBN8618284.1 DUF402 domain-containing protein [Anaerolineae bacterium]